MIEDKRIYVVVAGTVQVPALRRSVIQPPGRQIAQACHVVSKLRWQEALNPFGNGPLDPPSVPKWYPVTTIILQARDSAELRHVQILTEKKLYPAVFFDTNPDAYGPGEVMTALAVFATKKQIENILDYLPLWGA
jgi:hypothetical protein